MKNKTCGECRKFRNIRCGHVEQNYPACLAFEPKQTNGDVTRQMSNARLAEFLRDAADDIGKDNRSVEDILAWLDAPAESEGRQDIS